MPAPRNIDYCKLSRDIQKDPTIKVSQHLEGEYAMTMREQIFYAGHIRTCDECDTITAEVASRAPKPTLEDNVKNEN